MTSWFREKVLRKNDALDYNQFFDNPSVEEADNIIFSTENTKMFLMKSIENRSLLQESSIGKPNIDSKHLGELIFSACCMSHGGIGSKIHVLESYKQILLCYIFHEDRSLRRKDRSPNGCYSRNNTPDSGKIKMSTSSSYQSAISLQSDQDNSLDDELNSSMSSSVSVPSIRSFVYSIGSSIGHSLNSNFGNGKIYPSATPPSYPSLICRQEGHLREVTGTGLKRTFSSPSQLAAEGVQNRHRKIVYGLGILFNTNTVNGPISFNSLKSFIFDKFMLLETQVIISIKEIHRLKNGDMSIDDIADHFLSYINILSLSRRLKHNMWQRINLGGLVGSNDQKIKMANVISDLYSQYQYQGDRNFMSAITTAILAANSTWHTNICRPYQKLVHYSSQKKHKMMDLFGGISIKFPVRMSFIAKDQNLLQGFLTLASYFQRNTIFVKNEKYKNIRVVKNDGSSLSVHELSCCTIGDALLNAVNSSITTNTFSLIIETCDSGGVPVVSSSGSDPTISNNSFSSNDDIFELDSRYTTTFIDHALSQKLERENLIVPNTNNLPIVSELYHPSVPLAGFVSTEELHADVKGGFSAFYESMKLSISEIIPKMVISNAISNNCTLHIFHSNKLIKKSITASAYVHRILKNFMNLKKLTENPKLCLLYLESELETLSYIREAYLTFCECEASPPKDFLNIFNLHPSDEHIFDMYMGCQ